jgi:hypothetical protein
MSLLHVPRSTTEARELAAALASAVAALHARGRVHGRLHPGNVHVGADGAIALAEGGLPFHPDLADTAALGFAAPELLRGGKPSRRTDAFSLAAIAYALLAGRAPFEAGSPLETIRRVLHEDPLPLGELRPDLPAGLVAAVTRGLAKSAWRRPTAKEIAKELTARAVPNPNPSPSPSPTGTSEAVHPERSDAASAAERSRRTTPTAPSTATATPTATAWQTSSLETVLPEPIETASVAERARPARRRRTLLRVALAALPALALATLWLPQSEASLEGEIASLIAGGRLGDARAKLEAAAKARRGDPLVEKLRGDVACARGASGECLRRYRVALAARPVLREDPTLRANARRLLSGAQSCGSRRAAAELLGELRDPAALPTLESARRSGGVFSWFCTGDAIDRAIASTRRGGRASTD